MVKVLMRKLIDYFIILIALLFSFAFSADVAEATEGTEFGELSFYLDDYEFKQSNNYVAFVDKRFSLTSASVEEYEAGYLKDGEPDDLIGLYVSNLPVGGRLVSYSSALNMKLLGLVAEAPAGVYLAMANMDVGFVRIARDGSIKDGVLVVHYFSDVKSGFRFHKAVRYIFDGTVFDSILSKMSEEEVAAIFKG